MSSGSFPRILIAAPFSNSGKTTLTLAIIAALKRLGEQVKAYKCGPDYIDTAYHSFVSGSPAQNLDSYLNAPQAITSLLMQESSQEKIAVIEGVMGLFDGLGTTERASSAEIAKLTQTPVILVIPAHGMSRSVLALIEGFKNFDPELNLAGIIFSDIKSESHLRLLESLVAELKGLEYLGYLKHDEKLKLPSRQLGLTQVQEIEDIEEKLDYLALKAEESLDIQKIITLSKGAPKLEYKSLSESLAPYKSACRVKIGIIKDAAFNFYYNSSLRTLSFLGADLVECSFLEDSKLPEDISALYIGGGFPEEFAARLEKNESMRSSVKDAASSGMPIYAECGGYLYLCKSLTNKAGVSFELAAVFDSLSARLQDKKSPHFGYVSFEALDDTFLFKAGEIYRAHEFHHAQITGEKEVFAFSKLSNHLSWKTGACYKNTVASFAHIDFYAYPKLAQRFIQKACEYQDERSNH